MGVFVEGWSGVEELEVNKLVVIFEIDIVKRVKNEREGQGVVEEIDKEQVNI